ncbi:vam6 vps39-like protein [Lasius niger]|uniref:Vam6 vps39-like protein n=1 Tax=Lasius niger TaxID=67767 RepID=A0A0J7KCJ3_LASNI|nr:vam6 vps39-like protein [Lasius niger]
MQSVKGCKWSNNTIRKALRLKLPCGTSGYQELLAQGIPLPNERTLRRRSENIDFKLGICEQIFDILKQRVSQFTDDREKDCMLAVDEMSIMPGEQIDQSMMSHIGLSTLPDTFGK